MFNNHKWLDQNIEAVIDPELEIIDPHHHLWAKREGEWRYHLDDLLTDTGSGHHVIKTVFVECGAAYDHGTPTHRQSLGETRFIANMAKKSLALCEKNGSSTIAAIVSHTDLRHESLNDTLDAHLEISNGLLRGIRDDGAWTKKSGKVGFALKAPANLYQQQKFRDGVRCLGERSLSFDTWHFHDQNTDFLDLARAVPQTHMILDHFGTPIDWGQAPVGTPSYQDILNRLRSDLLEISKCPNVSLKLGGTAMTMLGFGWEGRERPCSSDEFSQAYGDLYRFAIDSFGPKRCMFESNFPMDKLSISYRSLWNGFKKITQNYSPEEKSWLFSKTAAKAYRL